MTTGDDRDPVWRRYLRLTRSNSANDVDDELTFHLQSTIDEYVAGGLTLDEARAAARRKFGDIEGISQTLYNLSEQRERTMNRGEWWESLKQDIVYGLRQLRKSPGFTIVALLTLALGIGANSAIFSVVHAVILTPLPFANGGRILSLREQDGELARETTFGNYVSWREQAKSFDAIAAWWYTGGGTLLGVGEPTNISGVQASASYWKVFSIKPVLGRYFTEQDEQEGAPPVGVLSEALWRGRFGGDSSIVGKTINLSGVQIQVLGVAPQDYLVTRPTIGAQEVIWRPLIISAQRRSDHADHELQAAGLVREGVPFDQATREMSRIERALAKEYPNSRFEDIRTFPYAEWIVGDAGKTVYMLFGAVTLVLLIACANVANLLIARGAKRRGEIAVRGALGASRGRIAQQLFAESVLLGVLGGLLGLVVAYAGIRFLVTSPASVPRLNNASLSAPVVAFTMALSIGCALLFGLAPALRAARTDLQQTLRDGGRESAVTSRDTFRMALVVGELCLAQVLLIGAALLVRSMMLISAVPVGFDTHDLLAFNISLPPTRYPDVGRVNAGLDQIEQSIAAIPGVKSVGRSQVAPIYSTGWNWNAMRPGSDGHDDGAVTADMRTVSTSYFRTLGLPLLRGRAFTTSDYQDGAPRTAIVSRSLAMRLYGNTDPVGLEISNGSVEKPGWRQIIGVVDDMRANGPGEDAPLTLYLPTNGNNNGQTFLVRGNVPVLRLMPSIRRAIASVDPLLAIGRPSTMDAAVAKLLAMPRFTMLLLTLLGVTGLVLAVVGVYGVVSYFVTQRTHEFGVRLALGASAGAVRGLVIRQALILAAIGVVMGGALAFAAVRLLRNMVFGITPHDPLTFLVVASVLGAVTVAASYIPARRATRIDPLEALRST